MASNNEFKKSHEAAILDDVLSFCRRCGGYKKKQASKLAGIIDSEHERPDLAIVRNDGSVVGLEHFRIDHHVGKDKKVKSKAAELAGRLEKERKTLVAAYDCDDDRLLDKLACIVGDGIAQYMQDRSNACCDDLNLSLSKRLSDEKTGHAQKLPVYETNLISRYVSAPKIELGYLIELHSDFKDLYLTDGPETKQLQAGECPFFEDVYDQLANAAEDVDWILLAFYPSIGSGLVDAAIVNCKNGMFKTSCARQGLSRTVYLGLRKNKPSRKQTESGNVEIEMVDGKYEISIAADAEEIDPAYLWNTAIADTALALNLRRRSEPFAATVSVQMLYEALLSESRRIHGEITSRTVLALLGKIPRSEIKARMEAFDKRYGIYRNAKREGSE